MTMTIPSIYQQSYPSKSLATDLSDSEDDTNSNTNTNTNGSILYKPSFVADELIHALNLNCLLSTYWSSKRILPPQKHAPV
jgi:hypothetical protein